MFSLPGHSSDGLLGARAGSRSGGGFTLIELLIVVAIIAILAAIAVPNMLEAQTRAKVSRVKADLRSLNTGLQSYRIDHNRYPEGTDNPQNYPVRIGEFLGDLAPGYYTLRTRGGEALTAGRDFFTLTTPVAYTTKFFTDPFAGSAAEFLTYAYRPAKSRGNGFILTSFGPDTDLLTSLDGRAGVGTRSLSPVSTYLDGKSPARLGDINERAVIHHIEGDSPQLDQMIAEWGGINAALDHLTYDPTNGTVSDGDIYLLGP